MSDNKLAKAVKRITDGKWRKYQIDSLQREIEDARAERDAVRLYNAERALKKLLNNDIP